MQNLRPFQYIYIYSIHKSIPLIDELKFLEILINMPVIFTTNVGLATFEKMSVLNQVMDFVFYTCLCLGK